jgi:hypothetical protein
MNNLLRTEIPAVQITSYSRAYFVFLLKPKCNYTTSIKPSGFQTRPNTTLMDFSEVLMNEFVIYIHMLWCGGESVLAFYMNLDVPHKCIVNCALINVGCRKCYDDGDLNAMYLMLKDTEG